MRRVESVLFLSIALGTATALPGAAAIAPLPSPVHVLNTAQSCSQRTPDVAALDGGGFVAAWTGAAPGAVGRLLDPEGAPVGGELELSGEPEGGVEFSRVAALADGGFAAAWVENRPSVGPQFDILLRAFDADGTPRGPAVSVVEEDDGWPAGIALAADGLGRPAVAWSDGAAVRFRLYDDDLTPRTEVRVAVELSPGSADLAGDLAIAAATDGELLIVWEEGPNPLADPAPPWSFDALRGRRFDAGGVARGAAFTIDEGQPGSVTTQAPAAAALTAGWAVAWARNLQADPAAVLFRLLDLAGAPAGPAVEATASEFLTTMDPDLEPLPGGGFALAWSGVRQPPPVDPLPPLWDLPQAFVRRFDSAGEARTFEVEIDSSPTDRHRSNPALAFGGDGRLVAVWRHHYPFPPILPPPCAEQAAIESRAFAAGCLVDDHHLCLQGGRIAIEVLVDDPRVGSPRPAFAEPLTDDTGTFWVFREENVEMAVKVLDGSEANGYFWFFGGSLSNLGYEIIVTNTLTGEDRRYRNLPGEVRSRADNRSLLAGPSPSGGATGAGAVAGGAPYALPSEAAALDAGDLGDGDRFEAINGAGEVAPACDGAGGLCLHDERFAVSIEWRNPRNGASGTATGVPLSDRAAYFWFFRAGNAEVVMKILDGTEINGFFWVFFGGLTDLEYTITIEDRSNSCRWRYDNPPLTLTSHADTMALTGLPLPCPPPPVGAAAGQGP